eukprot:gene10651-7398_t
MTTRSDIIRESFERQFPEASPEISKLVSSFSGVDKDAFNSLEKWWKNATLSQQCGVAQGYIKLLPSLLEVIEKQHAMARMCSALFQRGADCGPSATLSQAGKRCFKLLVKPIKTHIAELCTVLCFIVEQRNISGDASLCEMILTSENCWKIAANMWDNEAGFVALVSLLHKCVTSVDLPPSIAADLACKLAAKVDSKRIYSATEDSKIDTVLALLAATLLRVPKSADKLREAGRLLMTQGGGGQPASTSSLGHAIKDIFELSTEEVKNAAKLLRTQEMAKPFAAAFDSSAMASLQAFLFPENIPSVEAGTILYFLPFVMARCVAEIQRTVVKENTVEISLVDFLSLLLESSLMASMDGLLIHSPLDTFISVSGFPAVEAMLGSDSEEVKNSAFRLLASILKYTTGDAVKLFRHVLLSSLCPRLMESYLEEVAEAENTNEYVSRETCRGNLMKLMEVISLADPTEIDCFSSEIVPRIATIIAQSLTFPDLMQKCFRALTTVAEKFPYPASMVLDFDFIMEQFSIMDTPSDCNAFIIIGSLNVMAAMVKTAPVVITFEWIETLAKGIELLPAYRTFPEFASALWNCIFLTLLESEESMDFFAAPEVQERIAVAVEDSHDTNLLTTIIRSANLVRPHHSRVKAAIIALRSRLHNNDTDRLIVSRALLEAVAAFFTVGEEEKDESEVNSTENLQPATPSLLLVDLWNALSQEENSSVGGSIVIHQDLLQLTGECLASYHVDAAMELVSIVKESSNLKNLLDNERNARLRKSFIAAAVLADVLGRSKDVRCSSSVASQILVVMDQLALNDAFTSPILGRLSLGLPTIVNSESDETSRIISCKLLNSSLLSVLMRVFQKSEKSEASSEALFAAVEQAVLHSAYTSKELVEQQALLSFVDEFVLQQSTITASEENLLNFVLNFDDVRTHYCRSEAAERYKSVLEKLLEKSGGVSLVLGMYLQEVQQCRAGELLLWLLIIVIN